MNKELIEAGNILLAKICSDGKEVCYPKGLFPAETGYLLTFMKEDDKPVWWNKKNLKFDSSWDWLVPAVNICTKIIREFPRGFPFSSFRSYLINGFSTGGTNGFSATIYLGNYIFN